MPKKASAAEDKTPAKSASKSKRSAPEVGASSSSTSAAAAAAHEPIIPEYYKERPTVASVRAALPPTASGPLQFLRDAHFHWELVTGCYSLDPWEKVIFNIVFWTTVAGVLFYGFKYVSPLIQ